MTQEQHGLAIRAGKLIDGTGRAPIDGALVLIKEGKITQISRCKDAPTEDYRVIDAADKTVLPGLIDAHVHLSFDGQPDMMKIRSTTPRDLFTIQAIELIKRTLEAGFTSLRDLGGFTFMAVALRIAVEQGLVRGPRIKAAGIPLSQTGGHGDLPITGVRLYDGVDDVRKGVRENLKEGADLIKVFASGGGGSPFDQMTDINYSLDELRVIVEEASFRGKPVAAHANATKAIKNCLAAGISTIEHGIFLDEEGCRMMKEQGAILVPTLSAPHHVLEMGTQAGIPEWSVKKTQAVAKTYAENVGMAYRSGVKIAMGTDAGTPFNRHGDNALELQLLVEKAGLAPMDAVVAATRNAAEALFVQEQTGTLELGKSADIIIVDGDPLNDIRVLRDKNKIVLVIKDGNIEKNVMA